MTEIQPDIQLPKTKKVKVYTALLTQVGTAAPTAIIIQNTLGQTPTFARTGVGNYQINVTDDLFVVNKTFWTATIGYYGHKVTLQRDTLNRMTIVTQTSGPAPQDGVLDRTPIEIRVYDI